MVNIPKTINKITDNKKENAEMINNKLYNMNTNTYENIIYNKKEISINLLNKLDNCIMNISKEIIRNYLVKNIVYKLNNRIIEIQVNQNNLLVSLHRDAKQFDIDNKLFIRKGYESNSICYSVIIEDEDMINYIVSIVKQLYTFYTTPLESVSDMLFKTLKFKITTISETISHHHTNKGLVFSEKRNFAILSKTKYGVYVRILNVENKDNVLNIVTRKTYEPLCLSYKVKSNEDIDIIMPYIISSYEISKFNPLDLKNDFLKYYYQES